MKLGFFKIFFLSLLLILLGGFAWLSFVDVPVQQQQLAVNVQVPPAR